jgi:uncharacterized protein DUF4058
MSSPFPGMDPYLEAPPLWPEFHHNLVVCWMEVLLPSIGDRYRLRIGSREYVNQQVLLVSVIKEQHKEEYLEVRQRGTDKLITLVDLISPANRATAVGRQAYLAGRAEARQAGAHVVEHDLVLQGQTCLDIAPDSVPDYDYAITVGRARQPDRFEMYTTTVQKKLPRIRLPLASDDRDLVVDVQAIFTRCYDRFFTGRINYKKDPPILLRDSDHKWMVQTLKQAGLR